MTIKLSAGVVLLLIALALQFFFASAGVFVNLAFAALISFAFIFGFWELVALTLLATFIINWQPAASAEILIFALFPIAVYFVRDVIPWQPWVVAPIAVVLGYAVFYGIAGPGFFLAHTDRFALDLVAGLSFGALAFFPLTRF